MHSRDYYLDLFIKKHRISEVNWLSSDASTRRYARVTRKSKNYILMDSPLNEKPKEFVLVDKILRRHNIAAPKIYAKDLRHGFLLLEDFGSVSLSHAVKKAKRKEDFYILAIDTLVKLQKTITASELRKLPLALPTMVEENELFIQYYVPHILKVKLSSKAKQEFQQIWKKLFYMMQKLPNTLVLYDYHQDNIMVKADGSLGILDFQDAMKGPIFYDLISFVEDERYPMPIAKRKALLKHYLDLWPVLGGKKYACLLDVVAAHRHTRVMGIFARLAIKYKNDDYLKYIKNDWMFLRENLKNPLLAEYKAWIQKYLPKHPKG